MALGFVFSPAFRMWCCLSDIFRLMDIRNKISNVKRHNSTVFQPYLNKLLFQLFKLSSYSSCLINWRCRLNNSEWTLRKIKEKYGNKNNKSFLDFFLTNHPFTSSFCWIWFLFFFKWFYCFDWFIFGICFCFCKMTGTHNFFFFWQKLNEWIK